MKTPKKLFIIGFAVFFVVTGIILIYIRTSGTSGLSPGGQQSTEKGETILLTDTSQLSQRNELSQDTKNQTLAPIVTISANPPTVEYGGAPSVLSWSSTNATSCVDGYGNSLRLKGSISIALKENYTLKVVCTNSAGTTPESLTIPVTRSPVLALSAYPETIKVGEQSFISWSTINITECVDNTGKSLKLNDSVAVIPKKPYKFDISCTGPSGTVKKSVTIAVKYPPVVPKPTAPTTKPPVVAPPVLAPQITFIASPTTVQSGQTATMSWTATNATSCAASGKWSGTKGISGSETTTSLIGPLTYTYTLACTGPGGTENKNITINAVTPPPVIAPPAPTPPVVAPPAPAPTPSPTITRFDMFPIGILEGGSAALSWASTNATSCLASGSWQGTKATSGNAVSISNLLTAGPSTYYFYLKCIGPGGDSNTKSASVVVNKPADTAPTASFTVKGSHNVTLNVGESNTKEWSSTGGTTWSSVASFSQTAGSTTVCSQPSTSFSWSANTASGSDTGNASAGNAGCTAKIVYTVTNAAGVSASDTIYVTTLATPAASFTVNDSHNVTLNVGESNTKKWSSVRGVTWSSVASFSQAAGSATTCAQPSASFPWIANTASGSVTSTAVAENAGCTAKIVYTVTNADGGTASDTIYVTTLVTGPAPTISVSRSPTTLGPDQFMTFGYSTTNATSLAYYCDGAGPNAGHSQSVALQGPISSTDWSDLYNVKEWRGKYSCTWTATGPGGTVTYQDNFTILDP